MWCSACGDKLGDPNEELHDPKGEYLPDLGVVENPDSHHIRAVYGEKGMRIQCAKSGQMTQLLDNPPEDEEQGGDPSGGARDKATAGPERQPQGSGQVYDIEEEKKAVDVLKEVIDNPAYDLNEDQRLEVESWAEIYDGNIPADMFQSILSNLSGVSKQKAKLMRQKYEALRNKWLQEATSDDGGPPIGGFAPPSVPQQSGGNPSRRQRRSHNGGGQANGQQEGPRQPSREDIERIKQQKREQRNRSGGGRNAREERRQKVVNKFADEMAKNMAQDAGRFYSDLRNVMTTVLQRKAEKDPDWFLEKADEFGMDIIDELSEPSNARMEEMERGERKPSTDMAVDSAMESMMANSGGSSENGPPPTQRKNRGGGGQEPRQQPDPEPSREPTESNKDRPDPQDIGHPMKAAPDNERGEQEPEGDAFEELMGDVAE